MHLAGYTDASYVGAGFRLLSGDTWFLLTKRGDQAWAEDILPHSEYTHYHVATMFLVVHTTRPSQALGDSEDSLVWHDRRMQPEACHSRWYARHMGLSEWTAAPWRWCTVYDSEGGIPAVMDACLAK
jgi:hypothetical protein